MKRKSGNGGIKPVNGHIEPVNGNLNKKAFRLKGLMNFIKVSCFIPE